MHSDSVGLVAIATYKNVVPGKHEPFIRVVKTRDAPAQTAITFCVILRRISSIMGGISGRNIFNGGRDRDSTPRVENHRMGSMLV